MKPLITVQNLNVEIQGKSILQDISLNINEHDSVTIVGPNGAGKSMLLKCLLGLYNPNSGSVQRKDALSVAYVPQQFEPNPTMPINTHRFLRLHKKADADAVEQVSHETGIESALNKPLSTLSGGELQRVLLARALLGNPELLVLDEPAHNLDINGQLKFYKLLENVYAKRRLSILMVSHDLHMVMASTVRVICLYHHICCIGTPHIVAQDPQFISLFGHDMAKMMAVYQHSHNHHHE